MAVVLVWWLGRWWRAAPSGTAPAGSFSRRARTLVVAATALAVLVGAYAVVWHGWRRSRRAQA